MRTLSSIIIGAFVVLVLGAGTTQTATPVAVADAAPDDLTAGSCGSIRSDDMRYLCKGSCGSIRDDDLRYYCKGSCGSIRSDDLRYLCKRSCGSIRDDDLRYFCKSSATRFPFKR